MCCVLSKVHCQREVPKTDLLATASSNYEDPARYGPAFAIDGILSTSNDQFWHASFDEGTLHDWLQVQMTREVWVAMVVLHERGDVAGSHTLHQVQVLYVQYMETGQTGQKIKAAFQGAFDLGFEPS